MSFQKQSYCLQVHTHLFEKCLRLPLWPKIFSSDFVCVTLFAAKIGPPSAVYVRPVDGLLEVSISYPLTSTNTSMKDLVNDMDFIVEYWKDPLQSRVGTSVFCFSKLITVELLQYILWHLSFPPSVLSDVWRVNNNKCKGGRWSGWWWLPWCQVAVVTSYFVYLLSSVLWTMKQQLTDHSPYIHKHTRTESLLVS